MQIPIKTLQAYLDHGDTVKFLTDVFGAEASSIEPYESEYTALYRFGGEYHAIVGVGPLVKEPWCHVRDKCHSVLVRRRGSVLEILSTSRGVPLMNVTSESVLMAPGSTNPLNHPYYLGHSENLRWVGDQSEVSIIVPRQTPEAYVESMIAEGLTPAGNDRFVRG